MRFVIVGIAFSIGVEQSCPTAFALSFTHTAWRTKHSCTPKTHLCKCIFPTPFVTICRQGPAVWALRAQTDKLEYAAEMRRVLEATPNLSIREAMVTGVDIGPNDEVCGVSSFFGMNFAAKAVVLTTGTFMNGKIWVGRASMAAGRAGEAPSTGESLGVLAADCRHSKAEGLIVSGGSIASMLASSASSTAKLVA